jgi:hypothetical protein
MAFWPGCGSNVPGGSGFCTNCGQPANAEQPTVKVAPAQPVRAAEQKFFETEGVLVTNSRFVRGNETFAMSGVASAWAHTVVPPETGPMILIVFGAIVALAALQSSLGGAVLGVVLIGLGILWFREIKNSYFVRLVTASGERDAVSSFDANYIGGIVDAVNQAIIHHG